MQQQEKNIKGFNILELLVVIAIVGILSATAFPNIRAWIGDRDVRSAADKIKTLMQNINSQAQRGRYAYVQVFFEDMINAVEGTRHLVVSSNGMKISKLMNMVNDGASDWNAEDGNRGWCNFEDEDYWDDYGETTNTPEVGHYKFEGIAVNFIADAAAVCFSTEGTYYSGNGQFVSELGGELSIDSVVIICNSKRIDDFCDVNDSPLTPKPTTVENNSPIYAVNWTRFGNVTLEKWNQKANAGAGDWVLQ